MNKIELCIGSRVRLTRNHCTQLGIFQGSMGTVIRIGFPPSHKKDIFSCMDLKTAALHNIHPPLIYVLLDSAVDAAEKELKLAEKNQRPPVYAFPSAHESLEGVICVAPEVQERKIDGKVERWMHPLLVAHCTTFHKSQGVTAFKGVIVKPPKITNSARCKPLPNAGPPMGLCYVGISRAKRLVGPTGVFLLGPVEQLHFSSGAADRQKVHNEYSRLRALPGSILSLSTAATMTASLSSSSPLSSSRNAFLATTGSHLTTTSPSLTGKAAESESTTTAALTEPISKKKKLRFFMASLILETLALRTQPCKHSVHPSCFSHIFHLSKLSNSQFIPIKLVFKLHKKWHC